MPDAALPAESASAPRAVLYAWEGEDAAGRLVRGLLRAPDPLAVRLALRRQDILPIRIQRRWWTPPTRRITAKDIAVFTRQFAAMVKAGVPLLRGFDMVARGHANASLTAVLLRIRADVEAGATLSAAFGQHPRQFDRLYCSLVEAGETAGMLDLWKLGEIRSKKDEFNMTEKINKFIFYFFFFVVGSGKTDAYGK
ncbi:type II secretion system F family protein, partial [Leptospira sp. 96542]|nr:type II secretion system F family protein [Leptospira sp. 96542]